MPDKVTAPRLAAMKQQGEPIVCVTAYDAVFGAIAEEAGVDVVLVGDSVGNVMLGFDSTIPVSLEDIERHTRAVRAGVRRSFLVADMPFGSYQASVTTAVESAVRLMKAGAEGVKLEGSYFDEVAAMVKAGIPVMGHLGMTPQSLNLFGGHKVQGRGAAAQGLREAGKRLQDAGACSIVLELVPADLAAEMSHELTIPTIGIGAGKECDGQIQVMHDVLGLSEHVYKHAKQYAGLREIAVQAFKTYSSEVRDKTFPAKEHSF